MNSYTLTCMGGGEMGSCLANVFKHSGHSAYVWDIDSAKRSTEKNVKKIVSESAAVFITTPSWVVASVLRDIRDHMRPNGYVICLSKGMTDDGKTMYHVMNEMLRNPHGILAGPMIAEEINAGKSAYGVIAGNDDVCRFAFDVFEKSAIRMESEHDMESVAYASVLKNIYAIIAGMVEGWELGDNARGYVMAKILNEWDALADTIGINKKVLWGTAGEGDFIATSISNHSRNRMMGELFAKNGTVTQQSEGIRSLTGMVRLLKERNIPTPRILAALYNVFVHQQSPSELRGALNV